MSNGGDCRTAPATPGLLIITRARQKDDYMSPHTHNPPSAYLGAVAVSSMGLQHDQVPEGAAAGTKRDGVP